MSLSVGGQHHFGRELGSEQKGQASEALAGTFSPSVAETTLVPLPNPDASARLLQRNRTHRKRVCVCVCARVYVKERGFASKNWVMP